MALSPDVLERQKRHILIKEIGGPGVKALAQAEISIIGAGALGGPAALYLAAAGIGRIHLFDDDDVDRSNLQRQVQFGEDDIGRAKAACLAERLTRAHPHSQIEAHIMRVARETPLPGGILLDATDNFETRFALNEIAHDTGGYLISGAASRWAGQVSVFASGVEPGAPCYRCWVPGDPPAAEACDDIGVVGPVTGLVATRMALETLKLITGAGPTLIGALWVLEGLSGETRTLKLRADPHCPVCGSKR